MSHLPKDSSERLGKLLCGLSLFTSYVHTDLKGSFQEYHVRNYERNTLQTIKGLSSVMFFILWVHFLFYDEPLSPYP